MIPAADATAHVREEDFQRTVLALAEWFGWSVYHTFDSRRSQPGFPDIVALHPGPPARLVVFEIKTDRGPVTPDQQRWLALFAAVPGVVARVVRPADWDAIEALLREES